jgi:aryl-alcohol dehydrogenase-like predicted oxidoreductase
VIDAVSALANRHGASAAQVTLAWLAAWPGVTSVLLGARTLQQLVDNLGAAEVLQTAEELAQLDRVSDPEPIDYPYGRFGTRQRRREIGRA